MKLPSIPGFQHEAFQKYLKNTGWIILGKALSIVIALIIIRYLGPKSFGELSFAEAFVSFFSAVGALGLDSFIIREIINEPEKKDEILGTSFWLRFTFNLVIIPVSVICYLIFRDTAPNTNSFVVPLLIALLATASIFKSFNIIDSYYQSQVESKYVVQVQNICLLLSAGIKVGLVVLKASVIFFAIAVVFDGLLLALGLVLLYHKKGLSVFTWKYDKERALLLLKQSWPLIFSAVMVSLYMKIDVVMLKSIRGSKEVGVYNAAAKISEAWYFIPTAIITSVFPAILNARKSDYNRYIKRLQNLYDLLVAISLPVALVISFSADFIIHLAFGDRFQGAGTMLSIHIWSGIFVFLGIASSQYLLTEGLTRTSFLRTSVGAVVNIILNLWLIPKYGGVGASWATLAAYFIATFSLAFHKKSLPQMVMMLKSLFLISFIQKILNR